MRILFICRGFAPDSVIGAIRVTKLVKYMSKQGHDISVITSGVIFGKISNDTMIGLENVKIYNYENIETIQKKYNSKNVVHRKSSKKISRRN